jgi:hypothetical protein
MSNILETLRLELDTTAAKIPALEAEAELAQKALRFALDKVERITGLVAVLEAEAAATTPDLNGKSSSVFQYPPGDQEIHGKYVSKRSQMNQEITNLLTLRGTVHRSHILEHLISRGLMGLEKSPMAHLAAFLSSNRDKFEYDGSSNFRLRQPSFANKEIGPPNADPLDGPKEVHGRPSTSHGVVHTFN